MDDHGDVGAELQTGIHQGTPHAEGRDHGRDQKSSRRPVQCEQFTGAAVPVGLRHLRLADEIVIRLKPPRRKCIVEAFQAAGGEVHADEPVQKRDTSMAEIEEQSGCAFERAAVVHVDPVVGFRHFA